MSDLIRREDVISLVSERKCGYSLFDKTEAEIYHELAEVIQEVWKLPNAEPKVGKWIRIGYDIYECSECHQYVKTSDIDAYDWCHHCGAKMERSE